MRIQRVAIVLSVLNATILLLIWFGPASPLFAKQEVSPVVRTRALQVVDAAGRVRASISVEAATTVDGKEYPETVLLRLIDPASGPVVKLTAAANGSALGLSDDARGGVQIYARDTGSFVRVVAKDGRAAVLRP